MSSTGATLSGSYSDASSVPTDAGFKYGTTSGNLTSTASSSANGTSGNLSASLTGLIPGQTYYYKAFVTVSGTQDYSSQSDTFYGAEYSFTTKKVATATVSNSAATGVTSSNAVLNGSYTGASGQIYETGFYWGTSQNSLPNKVTTDGSNAASGNFSCTIGEQSPLSPSTTYYFKAYVLEYDENSGDWVERTASSVLSFTTPSASQPTGAAAYLVDYGMPDVSGFSPTQSQSGTYSDKDDKWYRFSTSNNKRQIAVHTYSQGAPNNAETVNYVVLYDESKYAPLWTAHTMNTTYWANNKVGRNDSWMDDPAISLTQQDGLDDAGTVGYSKGHLVASNYRQTTVKQNKQTFYYSNQAPQWQNSFNSGVWSSLEEAVAANAPGGTTMMYVVTGVLYEGTVSNGEVTSATVPKLPSGSLNVPIPSHFYKCIMKCTFNAQGTMTGAEGIAYIFTNEAHSGHYYDSDYVTTIDAIEARAGFDFFATVPTNLQNAAESEATPLW